MVRGFYPLLMMATGLILGWIIAHAPLVAAPIQDALDIPRDRPGIATDIFTAISLKQDKQLVAAYLKEALTVSRRSCERVSDYQVYRQQPNRMVFKVKCPARQIFGITVANNGFLAVYGGDGMIKSFSVTDGPVVILSDEDEIAAENGGNDAIRSETGQPGSPANSTSQDRAGISPLVIISVAINLFVIGTLLLGAFFVWQWMKTKQTRTKQHKQREGSQFSSGDKDAFLDESEEILPDIFQHPDKIFIVRGRHGKRRIFPILITAILYRDYGVKILEIR